MGIKGTQTDTEISIYGHKEAQRDRDLHDWIITYVSIHGHDIHVTEQAATCGRTHLHVGDLAL